MKRLIVLAIPLAVVACSGPDPAKALSEKSHPESVIVAQVVEIEAPLTIPVLGAITSDSRSNVGAEVDGRVVALLVKEGDRVRAGQPLVQLAGSDASTRLEAARGGLNQAILSAQADERIAQAKLLQAKLHFERTKDRLTSEVTLSESRLAESQAKYDQLKRGPRPQEIEAASSDLVAARLVVESNQATADFTKLILKRKSALLAQGGIAQNDVDQAQLDYDHAVQSVRFAEQQLRSKELYFNLLKEGTPKEELAQGAAQLTASKEALRAAKANLVGIEDARQVVAMMQADQERATARVKQLLAGGTSDEGAKFMLAQEDVARTKMCTPIDGVVASIKVVKGQVARAGQIVAEIVGQGGVRMEATAMDQDLGKISAGQAVTITLRDDPSRTFRGSVQQVLPRGNEGRSARIMISMVNATGAFPGSVANGEVQTSLTQKVLQIPTSALFGEVDGVADVFVLDGDQVRQRPIHLGSRKGEKVAVVSGLTAGDQVVVQPSKSLHDGSAVKAQSGLGGG